MLFQPCKQVIQTSYMYFKKLIPKKYDIYWINWPRRKNINYWPLVYNNRSLKPFFTLSHFFELELKFSLCAVATLRFANHYYIEYSLVRFYHPFNLCCDYIGHNIVRSLCVCGRKATQTKTVGVVSGRLKQRQR